MFNFNQKSFRQFFTICAVCTALLGSALIARAQTTTVTYQGRLTDAGAPANRVYDLQFQLYTASGTAVGAAVTVEDVTVTNGVFTTQINFDAAAFQQSAFGSRLVEVRVRPGDSTGAFTALAPRQPLTDAPYAVSAANAVDATNAENAENADALGGVAANQFVRTTDARLTDDRNPIAGSANYIQNNSSIVPQSGSFNVLGNGNANGTLSAGSLVSRNTLSVTNGITAGSVTATNGISAGSFTGSGAALTNLDAAKITTGALADARLTTNIPRLNVANTFTGTQSATTFNAAQFSIGNTKVLSAPGTGNFFAGFGAGATNTNGQFGSFVGFGAGSLNTTGNFNSFFGSYAGQNNDTGYNNAFVGAYAGNGNTGGYDNSFLGVSAGYNNTTGTGNVFVGREAGVNNQAGGNNTFIGNGTGSTNTSGNNNTLIGAGASLDFGGLTYATAIGAGATVGGSNRVSIGRNADLIILNGNVVLGSVLGGGVNELCFSSPGIGAPATIRYCSSSIRYKKDVENFTSGLDLVKSLRPVTFTWKSDNKRDLGFVAEEVNAVEPLMTTYNEKGEVEGVKYDRISAALVNAVNEQQTQIEAQKTNAETQAAQFQNQQKIIENQQRIIERQQQQIDALVKAVCAANTSAAICRQEEK